MRPRRTAGRIATAAGLAALPALSGCGSGDLDKVEPATAGTPGTTTGAAADDLKSVDVVTYASGVCTAQVAYYDRAASELKHGLAHAAKIKSAMSARSAMVSELKTFGESVAKPTADLRAVGAPKIDGGKEAAESLLGAFGKVPQVLDSVRRELATLPDKTFAARASSVLAQMQTRLDAAVNSAGDEPAEIEAAYEGLPACAPLVPTG